MTRIEIKNEEDRITIAAILVKNGYTVRIVRDRQTEKSIYKYFIEFEK